MLYKWIYWLFQKRNFATILLVLFLTQIVFIEGYSISYVKVGVMALCPILLFYYRIPITKAMVLCSFYFVYIVLSASFYPESFRFSTLIYFLLFLFMYVLFYSLVHTGAFILTHFIKVVKYLILAYCLCLISQQICILSGIRFFPLVNLNQQHFLSLYRLPSLAIEPSHAARILGVLFYAYLRCSEFQLGYKVRISELFNHEHRLVTFAFLWSMLTMGSGTAFLSMGVISLYFMQGRQLFWSIPIFVGVFFILDFFEIQQAKRVASVVVATSSLDAKDVMETDGSAAMRIKPVLNTLRIDLTQPENWFGRGCDAGLQNGLYSDDRYIGGISSYGLIGYFLSLIVIFSCAIRFFSIPTIMFFMGIGGNTGNIAYCWGIILVFTCLRYYQDIQLKGNTQHYR